MLKVEPVIKSYRAKCEECGYTEEICCTLDTSEKRAARLLEKAFEWREIDGKTLCPECADKAMLVYTE